MPCAVCCGRCNAGHPDHEQRCRRRCRGRRAGRRLRLRGCGPPRIHRSRRRSPPQTISAPERAVQPHGGQAAQQESCRNAAQRAARKIGGGPQSGIHRREASRQQEKRRTAAASCRRCRQKGLMLPQIGQTMEQGKQQHAAPAPNKPFTARPPRRSARPEAMFLVSAFAIPPDDSNRDRKSPQRKCFRCGLVFIAFSCCWRSCRRY